jgi:predicted dehydrogenase
MDYDDFNNFQLFHRAGSVLLPKIDFKEPIWLEASHFIECVKTGRVPLTGPEHAKKVIAVLEAGQASLRTGQTMKVDLA